ncbi:hypothetical protein [Oleiharenicola lentus]|uniref:hypothetical protein n=1 Tax=Oleiharenicola lentus TaxID=2508720 RepID=UPI003F660DB0
MNSTKLSMLGAIFASVRSGLFFATPVVPRCLYEAYFGLRRKVSRAVFGLFFTSAIATAAFAYDVDYPDPVSADSGSYEFCNEDSFIESRMHATDVYFYPQYAWVSGSIKLSGFDGDAFGVNLDFDTTGLAPGRYLVAVIQYHMWWSGYPDQSISFYVTIE